MTLKIIVHPEAIIDIDVARQWYEKIQPSLGDRFAFDAVTVIESVFAHPLMFAVITADFRRARIAIFPYHVYYEATDGLLIIFGVYHERRDPSSVAVRLAARAAKD